MISHTSSETSSILMRSISKDYCTEWALLNIIVWGCLFGFIFIFWSRLIMKWRCWWWWFGCTDFLMKPLRWFWLWYRKPTRWYRRWDWWHWHPLIFERERDMWQRRCCSCNWNNNSGFFGGLSEEFCYFDKCIFGSVTIFQWWYNRECDFQDGKNVWCWLIEIILWCDRREINLGRKKCDCVNISNGIGWL